MKGNKIRIPTYQEEALRKIALAIRGESDLTWRDLVRRAIDLYIAEMTR